MKSFLKQLPLVGPLLTRTARSWQRFRKLRDFRSSSSYWDKRYRVGGNSGSGSYGEFASYKAEVLNAFVAEHAIQSVIEYGCGDGNQLTMAQYPSYLGFDVSPTAIAMCRERFAGDSTKSFSLVQDYAQQRADLTMSLDVVYHLVEDKVYGDYMERLFDSADRFVVVYASNTEKPWSLDHPHVRHRCFTDWVVAQRPAWRLLRHIPNPFPYDEQLRTGTFADFYFFVK